MVLQKIISADRGANVFSRAVLLVAVFGVTGVSQTTLAQDEPAPVFEAIVPSSVNSLSIQEMEKRISQLERQLDNQALVEMMTNLDTLQREIQQLVGQLEEQTHSLDSLRKRQRDLYLDIDKRLQALEKARETVPAAPAAGAPTPPGSPSATTNGGFAPPQSPPALPSATSSPATPAADSAQLDAQQLERKNYELAFNLLKEGQYDKAVAAFQAFLGTYPNGRFSDNAQYWLGEANYVQRRFSDALAEFDKVLKNHPQSPKRADAMLKMGYTYQELGDSEKARVLLNDVIRDYPSSTAASLAKKRLQDFQKFQ